MEDQGGSSFKKRQPREEEECGGSKASGLAQTLTCCNSSELFSDGHKSHGGLSWQQLAWLDLNGGEAYTHFNTLPTSLERTIEK